MEKTELREVYFDKYCKMCEARNTSETDEPCNTCLESPVNVNCHKPVMWKEKEGK